MAERPGGRGAGAGRGGAGAMNSGRVPADRQSRRGRQRCNSQDATRDGQLQAATARRRSRAIRGIASAYSRTPKMPKIGGCTRHNRRYRTTAGTIPPAVAGCRLQPTPTHATAAVPARVCVLTLRECGAVAGRIGKPQDGGATPRRGRGLRPRRDRTTTTTTGTLEEYSSSKGRESSTKVPPSGGASR